MNRSLSHVSEQCITRRGRKPSKERERPKPGKITFTLGFQIQSNVQQGEGRRQQWPITWEVKRFPCHAPFLGKLLRNTLHQNEGLTQERGRQRKLQVQGKVPGWLLHSRPWNQAALLTQEEREFEQGIALRKTGSQSESEDKRDGSGRINVSKLC